MFTVPEQPTIGRGGVERLIEWYDPVEELWRESQRRHGGQEAVVAEFAWLNSTSSAAPAAPAAATTVRSTIGRRPAQDGRTTQQQRHCTGVNAVDAHFSKQYCANVGVS